MHTYLCSHILNVKTQSQRNVVSWKSHYDNKKDYIELNYYVTSMMRTQKEPVEGPQNSLTLADGP